MVRCLTARLCLRPTLQLEYVETNLKTRPHKIKPVVYDINTCISMFLFFFKKKIYISMQIQAVFNVGVCHALVRREQLHDRGGSAVQCRQLVGRWLLISQLAVSWKYDTNAAQAQAPSATMLFDCWRCSTFLRKGRSYSDARSKQRQARKSDG